MEALLTLLDEEGLGISTVGLGTNAHTLPAFVAHPFGMIGSDALLFGDAPNPRSYGCFPIVLAEFVRAERHLRLPEAIRKMTSFPAQRIGIPDRGILRDGFKADIVVFDKHHVKTRATQEHPKVYPEGIPYVIVNGEVVIDAGEHTGVFPGAACAAAGRADRARGGAHPRLARRRRRAAPRRAGGGHRRPLLSAGLSARREANRGRRRRRRCRPGARRRGPSRSRPAGRPGSSGGAGRSGSRR